MSKSKYSAEEKFAILHEYDKGGVTKKGFCLKYEIDPSTFDSWKYKCDSFGIDGLNASKQHKEYSKELKLQAVYECLYGEGSIRSVARNYGISDHHLLRQWIKQYNSHREIRGTSKGRDRSMTKGRATNLQERIKITEYCIANNKDYQKAIETFEVSYYQIYHWVRRYEEGGTEALKDGRGRNKDESELTPEEKQKLAMKVLESENERLRAENAFLKKWQNSKGGGIKQTATRTQVFSH